MARSLTAPNRALRRAEEAAGARQHEFLVVVLAGELYGVPLLAIREILAVPPLTEVPRAPRAVMGVCSVRGLLVTVVDLRARLRLPAPDPTRRSRILLTTAATQETIGLLVDEVRQVIRLGDGEIEPAASALGGEAPEYVLGIGRPNDELVLFLELAKLLPS